MTLLRREFDPALLDRLPPLPAAVLDLLRSFDDEDVSAAEVARKISQDPTLCLRVLKVVNSPFYGLPRQIGSLSEAVIVLGFSLVRSLATGASLMANLPAAPQGSFDARALWEHSIYCALCARLLAKQIGVDRETAFTAGLLHEIGTLVMYHREPALYEQICGLCVGKGLDVAQAERELLDTDHAQVGARVLALWHLPAAIEHAVACHHQADVPPYDNLGDLIQVADIIAQAATDCSLAGMIAAVEPHPAFVRLGLSPSQCSANLEPVFEEFAAMRGLLDES